MPIHGYPGNVITANPTAPTSSVATGVWTTEQQLLAVSQGNWPGYEYPIANSLRFNSADSAYLNRTPASAGNRRTWTWSGWIKRSGLGIQVIFGVGNVNTGSTFGGLYFNTDDTLVFYSPSSGGYSVTNQVFRDPSAWYHIVCGYDTPNSIVKLYVNGVEITAYSTRTNPSANVDGNVNAAVLHTIGRNASTSEYYLNGYLTEVNFIDGQALTPSSFGLNDPETGVWSPKRYTGTYGTNGFYLNFSDNSGTTSTTLGKDYSGNGNNWTPNNFSVTAGAGNDSLVDTPTAYGTDTGVGGTVRGNYATFNALQLGSSTTLNNGNLDSAATASSFNTVSGTMFASSGKWYAEVTILDVSADYSTKRVGVGIIKDTGTEQSSYLGSSTSGYAYYANATKYNNATSGSYGASYVTNDVIGIAMDLDAGTLVFYKNNTSQGTAYSGLSGAFSFAASHYGSGAKVAINFGQRAFAYTAPSGFKALCTQNLPTPTIGATSTTQANDYFDISLYTGNGTSQSITGLGFQPDFIWFKGRNTVTNHAVLDAVRGRSKIVFPSLSDAEATSSTTSNDLVSFNANGFSVGIPEQSGSINTNGTNVVAWCWNAGGSTVTNTSGTISAQVRASTTAGFSVVTYTGNGTSGATIGHGLGVAPSMIMIKERATSTWSWGVYHASVGNTAGLYLNLTNAATTTSVFWNNTSPTSSVFSVGNWGGVNGNTSTYVAYCFAAVAGYSAFGSYTGNGSTDGPFVYTGFRPRFIFGKDSGGTNNWWIFDSARDTYNVAGKILRPNLSDAELDSPPRVDLLSNGFKIRSVNLPNDATTYIYAAFAESPFKYALAR